MGMDARIEEDGGLSMRKFLLGLTGAALAAAAATPALAEDAGVLADAPAIGDWTLSGGVTAVSDYRFRGISLSNEKAAIQPTLTLSHASGFYVGTWQSSITGDPAYGKWEVDLYAGWSGEVASGTTVDAAILYYYYPDGHGDSDYFEPYVTVSHMLGPVTAKTGLSWAPSSNATGNADLIYVFGELEAAIPTTPLTLTGRLGNQDLGGTSYTEWALGASATFGAVTAGVEYVDSDLPSIRTQDAAVVFSLGVNF